MTEIPDLFAANSIVWPLCFLLVALLIIRRVREEIHPIVANIVGGVAKNAGSNAPAYAIAILFGLSASISAFIDVFEDMTSAKIAALSWHQYLSGWARILNPFIVAVLAYATQNKFKGGQASSATNPPFSKTNPNENP